MRQRDYAERLYPLLTGGYLLVDQAYKLGYINNLRNKPLCAFPQEAADAPWYRDVDMSVIVR